MNTDHQDNTGEYSPDIKVPMDSNSFVQRIANSQAAEDFVGQQYVRLLFNTSEPPCYVDQSERVRVYNLQSIKNALERKKPISDQDARLYAAKIDDPILLELFRRRQEELAKTEETPINRFFQESTINEIIGARIYSLENLVGSVYNKSDMTILKGMRDAKQQEQDTLSRIFEQYPEYQGRKIPQIINNIKRTMPIESKRLESYFLSVEMHKRMLNLSKEGQNLTDKQYKARIASEITPLEARINSLGIYDTVIDSTKTVASTIDATIKNNDKKELIVDFGVAAACGIIAGIASQNIGAAGITTTAMYYIMSGTRKGMTSTVSNITEYTKELAKLKRQEIKEVYSPNSINLRGFWIPGGIYVAVGTFLNAAGKLYETGLKTWSFVDNHLSKIKMTPEDIAANINNGLRNYESLSGPSKIAFTAIPLLGIYMIAGKKIGNYQLGAIPKQNFNTLGNALLTVIKDALYISVLSWNVGAAHYIKKGANAVFNHEFETFKLDVENRYRGKRQQLKAKHRVMDTMPVNEQPSEQK